MSKSNSYPAFTAHTEYVGVDTLVVHMLLDVDSNDGASPLLQKKGVREDQMPFCQPYDLEQCGWVANRWCEILPLTSAQKHHLLSIDNAQIRLDLVKELIEEMTGQSQS